MDDFGPFTAQFIYPYKIGEYPWTESLQWYTQIHTSSDGMEERQRLLVYPKRRFLFAYNDWEYARQIDSSVVQSGVGPYVIGDFGVRPISGIVQEEDSGSLSFRRLAITDEQIADFGLEEGDYIVLSFYKFVSYWQVGQINPYVDDETWNVFLEGLSIEYQQRISSEGIPQAGQKVYLYPAYLGIIPQAFEGEFITSRFNRVSNVVELQNYKGPEGVAPESLHDGIPVFDTRPNQEPGAQTTETQIPGQRYDTEIGKVRILPTAQRFSLVSQRYRFLTNNALDNFRAFLQWLGGRNQTVFIPTRESLGFRNIQSGNRIGTGAVWSRDYIVQTIDLSYRKYIYVQLKDGTHQTYTVDSVNVSARTMTLVQTIDFTADEVALVCWMMPARLAVDEIEIEHIAPTVSQTTLTWQEVAIDHED